ncbi:alpha-amylase [Roridomyces roridus]|uniref:Alpha-amylase n=1 Tax=Roridomyces roridus TaxID=1738132 RepID=A0AAD7C214_9AGAR|nr:alpha-amylase [Roridomyces roridus]
MSSHANAEYSKKDHNYTMLQAFEWYIDGGGVHWKRIADLVPELASMGMTAMWLPPPTKAAGQDSVGYDIFDLYDLGEFDQKGGKRTNWGTKAELIAAITKAREHGIVSYVDAVLNHRFGAERKETFAAVEVDNDDRTKEVSELYDIEGWTGFDFAGRGGKYSDMKYTFNHFTGVDYNDQNQKTAIYKIHGDGKDWALGVDKENTNYDYLMGADVDHEHSDVRADYLNWGKWVTEELGTAGFRFDAVKHIDRSFIADFVKSVRAETSKPKMFAVGEFWKDSLEDLEAYLDSLGTQFSVFDAPLHYNFKEAGDRGSEYDLRAIWDGTVVQKRPIDAVTLVENHDTQIGQSLESAVNTAFKPLAYALILLRPDGYPCVFWGDLYGTGGDNPQQAVKQLGDLVRARKLFAYGEVRDYWDHMNCVGWVRMGEPDKGRPDGCAVVISNGDEGNKRMEVGKEHANEQWTDVLGWNEGEVVIGEDGWAEFRCSAMSVSVWVKSDAKGREEFGR